CLLGGIEFFPGHGAHGMDHVVVDMPRDREIFLHLIELIEVDNRDRVFLAVDDSLRQREVEFRESNGLHRGAERLHRGLDLQFGRRAQFQTLHVVRAVDRSHGIGHVAKAVFPIRSRIKPCCSASGASQVMAGPSSTRNACCGPSKMKGSMTAAKALSYLSSCPCVGSPMSMVPSLICCACSGGPPSTLLGKILILTAPPVRSSTRLANSLAAMFAG